MERSNRLRLTVDRSAKRPARARETGHDRSNRNLQNVRQFLIRQALQLAKHEKFAKTIRQCPQGLVDERRGGGMKQ